MASIQHATDQYNSTANAFAFGPEAYGLLQQAYDGPANRIVGSRIMGGLQMVGGGAVFLGGGIFGKGWGADQFIAGARTAWSGTPTESGTHWLAREIGGDGVADGVETALGFYYLFEGASEAGGTGAYLDGAGEGTGLGRVADMEIRVSQKGLSVVKQHLSNFGAWPQNTAMVERLSTALAAGEKVVGADASFYLHELSEATMMQRGLPYEVAHSAALSKYGVSPFSVYHPTVISAFPEQFNSAWRQFWGL
jgi:hypothetical protein